MAVSQILILVIAIIAFSWMIGGEVKEVSAFDPACPNKCVGNIRYYNGQLKANPNLDKVDECEYESETCSYGCSAGICKTTSKDNELKGVIDTGKDILIGGAKQELSQLGIKEFRKLIGKKGVNAVEKAAEEAVKKGVEEAGKKLSEEAAEKLAEEAIKKAAEEKGVALTEEATKEMIEGAVKNGNKLGKSIGDYFKLGRGTGVSQIVSNAVWATLVYVAINWAAKEFASQRNAGDISTVSTIGLGVGMGIATVWALVAAEASAGPPGWIAAVITIAAAGIYMLVGYQIYSREIFTFRTGLWQPPEGGADCNKCNSLTIAGQNGCSEYVCHSYGAACDWINDKTKYETCVEVNIGDVAAPIITPAKEIYGENVFSNDKYGYVTSSAGAKIVYTGEGGETGKCVPAFTPIQLAFKTNENANCKISIVPATGTTDSEKFKTMKDMAEGTARSKNHTLQLPSIVTASTSSLENAGYELTNNGNYKFYIRCEDVRGNINKMDYVMSFCVQQGPDTNPPKITGTNPAQNAFEPYGIDKIDNFQVYTNEPADCKWDFQPKSYNFMNYDFTKCSQNINDKIRGFDFGCQGNLTGFKNGIENKYYISCIDQPELKGTIKENKRNAGAPYELILKGTGKLLIESVKINGKANGTTIRDSRENVNVKIEVMTFGGAEEGKARCKYSEDKIAYSLFDNNNNRNYITTNTQNLYMEKGNYKYFLQCFDIAGNMAETMINFSVDVDKSPPIVVRVYKEDDYLKLITDEPGKCVYFPNGGCTYLFDEGTLMTSLEEKEYYAEWNIKNDLYIKCKDDYGNMPGPDECSIIARPFEIFAVQ